VQLTPLSPCAIMEVGRKNHKAWRSRKKAGCRGTVHTTNRVKRACMPGSFTGKIPPGTSKAALQAQLEAAGWLKTLARGGSKSGTGWTYTDPQTGTSVRIMTRPDGNAYARMQNQAGNYLTSDGQIPSSDLSSQQVRVMTHIELGP